MIPEAEKALTEKARAWLGQWLGPRIKLGLDEDSIADLTKLLHSVGKQARREESEEWERVVRGLLLSADSSWEEASAGHDWSQQVEAAREILRRRGRKP